MSALWWSSNRSVSSFFPSDVANNEKSKQILTWWAAYAYDKILFNSFYKEQQVKICQSLSGSTGYHTAEEAVFHSADFHPWRFFWGFKTKAVETISKHLSAKHLCEGVASTFLKSHFNIIYLFVNCLIIFRSCSWYSIAVIMLFLLDVLIYFIKLI